MSKKQQSGNYLFSLYVNFSSSALLVFSFALRRISLYIIVFVDNMKVSYGNEI